MSAAFMLPREDELSDHLGQVRPLHKTLRRPRTLGVPLLLVAVFVWGSAAMAQHTPYGTATVPVNASCQALMDTGYVPPAFPKDGKPRSDQANLLVQNCYPPYGNQIPNVNNTLDESGNLNFPAANPPPPKAWDQESAWNLEAVGYNDNQGRPIYQPLVFNYQNHTGSTVWRNREILFNGNAEGTAPNCLIPGCPVQPNGTSIIDVTTPNKTAALFHIPSGPTPSDPAEPMRSGAQMVRVCSGNQLNKDSAALSAAANDSYGAAWTGNPAIANRVFLLRQNGKGSGTKSKSTAKQEIWDVTDPTAPVFVADVLINNYTYSGGGPRGFVAAPLPPVFDAAHKSWWECDTGVAYIVGGKMADKFGTLQHIYVYNLRDPTHPVFIRQYAIAGGQHPASKNTGSCTNAPSDTCHQGTTNPPGGLHGPISMGNLVNRVYNAWGILSDGIVQITARDKLINGCFTSAASAWKQTGTATGYNPSASSTCAAKPGSGKNPTQADALYPQVSVVTMPTTQGAHSTMPVLGVPMPDEQSGYLDKGRPVGWDLLFVASEGTANNCSGQAAHEAWIETIGVFQLPGPFPSAPGGFANVTGAADQLRKTYHATDAQQWPAATLSVPQQPGGFCAKGPRFGAHAITEAIFPAYYGRIQCASWFGGGERCWDIRNPKNPLPIAYWISRPGPATTPIGNLGATTTSAGTYYPASGAKGAKGQPIDRKVAVLNHGEFDDRGFIYVVDRAGTGTAILQFNGGAAAQVIRAGALPPGTCPGSDCGSPNIGASSRCSSRADCCSGRPRRACCEHRAGCPLGSGLSEQRQLHDDSNHEQHH